jgi:predicted glycoside hydrolase/deacetylase ChbG (UPF0249 family)
MTGQPGTAEAVEMARANPSLELGWHLHLTDSLPCTRREWPWAASPIAAGFAMGFSPAARRLIRRELAAQWRVFVDTGLACRFVSAHHHLHIHPFVRRELERLLPPDFDGWIRWGRPCFFSRGGAAVAYRAMDMALQTPHRSGSPFRLSTTLWGIDRLYAMNTSEIIATLPGLGQGLHEFMFHPRTVTDDRDTECLLELSDRRPSGSLGA